MFFKFVSINLKFLFMKKQEVMRLYTFSDAALVTKGLEKTAFMQRDAIQFDSYGITADKVTELQDLITLFSDRLTDVEALGDQTGATALKDAKAVALREAISDIMARTELAYGTNSPEYRKFGTDTLSKQTDSDLYITGKRVVRVGTELLPTLSTYGLTATQLTAVANLSSGFSDLMVDMKIEIGDRDIKQEDRVEAGNEIYDTLVKYTNLGQSIWGGSDVAKFNDYILYNTISGEPEETVPAP